jgi:hypothetical protein
VIPYNVPLVVVRQTPGGEERLEMKAVVDSKMLMLPVDADIEEGDHVEQLLPNGKTRAVTITKVDVIQSPFGSSELDHTEARYSTSAGTLRGKRRDGPTVNVSAVNVQVATGDRTHQTMTVGQTSDQLVLVIEGLVEMLQAFSLASGREGELAEVEQAAVADVTSDQPSGSGVRRFYEWVVACVAQGGTAATAAAVTAAANGLIHDTEALIHAMSG